MSVRTKYMAKLYVVANAYVEIEVKARGLADQFFDVVKYMREEVEMSDMVAEYASAMIKAEEHVKDQLPDGVTLGEFCTSWKVRKSEFNSALKLGIDPKQHKNYKSFVNAAKKLRDEKKGIVNGGGAPTKGGSSDKAASKLHSVTKGLPNKVSEKLNLIAKHLAKLDEAQALQVLNDCDGAIHRLAKAGGRYSNVDKKTA